MAVFKSCSICCWFSSRIFANCSRVIVYSTSCFTFLSLAWNKIIRTKRILQNGEIFAGFIAHKWIFFEPLRDSKKFFTDRRAIFARHRLKNTCRIKINSYFNTLTACINYWRVSAASNHIAELILSYYRRSIAMKSFWSRPNWKFSISSGPWGRPPRN